MEFAKENRIEVLRTAAIVLYEENRRLALALSRYKKDEANAAQQLLQLEERLSQANKELYGKSSEKRPVFSRTPTDEQKKTKTGHGPTQQELPIEEVIHELDDADKSCPCCGKPLTPWQGHFEESEEIDVVIERYVLKKHRRQKYRCGCGHIDTAIGPEKLQSSGRYSLDFAIDVAVKKYADHIPLSRQERIALRSGLKVTTQALWDQLNVLSSHLEPILKRLLEHLHSKEVVGADETTWRMLNKKSAKKHYVWALCSDDAVLYRIANTRGAKGAKPLLDGYKGRVMADDYNVYQALANAGAGYSLDACWAHVRRKFIEAEDNEPKRAAAIIALIRELYRIDKMAVGPPGSNERRNSLESLRQQYSVWILRALRQWAFHATSVLPESSFGKALRYMRNCFPRLSHFAEDGRIALDNNGTERALRGIVVGRKNHYGSKSPRGTKVASLFYSLIESSKLAGECPREYLKTATLAAIREQPILLPHELQSQITQS